MFEVVAAGDLNGDGRDDVLMRHAQEGRWIHYRMSRTRGALRHPRLTRNLLFGSRALGMWTGTATTT